MRITESQLRRIVREEILRESNVPGPKLSAEIASGEGHYDWAIKKWGPDVFAVWSSLPIDLPIDKVAKKLNAVRKALGGMSITDAYENDRGALMNAIAVAGLSGRQSDRLRDPADWHY